VVSGVAQPDERLEDGTGHVSRRRSTGLGWVSGQLMRWRFERAAGFRQRSEPTPETVVARVAISALSLGCLGIGLPLLAVGADTPGRLFLLVFVFLGIGSAPWQRHTAPRLPTRLTLTMLTGFSVLTLVSVAMLALDRWEPTVAFALVAAACVPLHVIALHRALWDEDWALWPRLHGFNPREGNGPRESWLIRWVSPVSAGAGALLCLGSAVGHRHIDPGFLGFLTQIGPVWYLGLALLLAAVAMSSPEREYRIAIPVVLVMLALTLTPSIVYDGPRSQSAAKHVDLILQIQTLGRMDTAAHIYEAWPGFFGATAWVSDISRISDPMTLATFWPPLIGLFRVVALRYFFGQVLRNPHQAWVAVTLAVLADPIGADYFSPQSVGFVVGLAVFGFALSKSDEVPRLGLIFLAGWILAMSHQLSPYTIGGVLVILVVFRQVRPWWTPLLILGPAVFWAAVHRGALEGFISLKLVGRSQNFRPPKTSGSPGLERLPIVRETVVALLVGIFILGILSLVVLVRHRRDLRLWAFACCPAAGLVLVALNPYGQEGIFRAVLFGIPWLAVLAGHLFPSIGRMPAATELPRRFSRRSPRSTYVVDRTAREWASRIVLLAIFEVLAYTFLIASFGLDASNVIRQGDVAAYRYFQQQSTDRPVPRYILALGGGDLPTVLPPESRTYQSVSRDTLKMPVQQERVLRANLQVQQLTARFTRYARQPTTHAELYAVWSPVSSDYDRAYGLQSPAQFAALRDGFLRSAYWDVVLAQDGTYLFRFESSRYRPAAK